MSPGNNRFRSIESYEQMELVHLSTHCVPFCSKSFQTKQRFGFLYMKCPSRDRAHWCRWAYIVKIHPSWWHKCVFWQLRYLHERLYCEYSKVGSHKIADWWLMECPCATLLAIHLLVFIHFFFQHCCHWAVGYWLFKNLLHISVFQIRTQKREKQIPPTSHVKSAWWFSVFQICRHCDLWGWKLHSMEWKRLFP